MMNWIHSVLHTSLMWARYIQMCHLMMHQLLFRVCFICSEGILKIRPRYIARHHTTIRNGKNPAFQHKPRGVLHTMWCFHHINYGSGSTDCNWKHVIYVHEVVQKNDCTCVYENIHEFKMLQQIPLSSLCYKSSMSGIQVHNFLWFCIRV